MTHSLLEAFNNFPEEASFIGRLLAAYGELEHDLMNCVAHASTFDATIKSLFSRRGETRRINEAERLGHPYYQTHNLGAEFGDTIADMRHCFRVRSQYAHCRWHDDKSGRLAFVNFEELARRRTAMNDLRSARFHYVTLTLLIDQASFFEATSSWLIWLNYEARMRAGTIASQVHVKPARMSRPPLHIP